MTQLTGDELLMVLAALANPIRLRIVARLAGERDYVSNLAREIGVSRPPVRTCSAWKPPGSSSGAWSSRRTARP